MYLGLTPDQLNQSPEIGSIKCLFFGKASQIILMSSQKQKQLAERKK